MRCGSRNHKCANISRTSRRSENKYIRAHTWTHTHTYLLADEFGCTHVSAHTYICTYMNISEYVYSIYVHACLLANVWVVRLRSIYAVRWRPHTPAHAAHVLGCIYAYVYMYVTHLKSRRTWRYVLQICIHTHVYICMFMYVCIYMYIQCVPIFMYMREGVR